MGVSSFLPARGEVPAKPAGWGGAERRAIARRPLHHFVAPLPGKPGRKASAFPLRDERVPEGRVRRAMCTSQD
jgi:hypothetical protein